jgi:hypothetical protein
MQTTSLFAQAASASVGCCQHRSWPLFGRLEPHSGLRSSAARDAACSAGWRPPGRFDHSHRAPGPPMRDRIEAIIGREGACIVPKSVGYFVGRADLSSFELGPHAVTPARHGVTRLVTRCGLMTDIWAGLSTADEAMIDRLSEALRLRAGEPHQLAMYPLTEVFGRMRLNPVRRLKQRWLGTAQRRQGPRAAAGRARQWVAGPTATAADQRPGPARRPRASARAGGRRCAGTRCLRDGG